MKYRAFILVIVLSLVLALAALALVQQSASAQDCRDETGKPVPCDEKRKRPTVTVVPSVTPVPTLTPVPPPACPTMDAAELELLCANLPQGSSGMIAPIDTPPPAPGNPTIPPWLLGGG